MEARAEQPQRERLYPNINAAAPAAISVNAPHPSSVVTSFETAQQHDNEKAARAREDSKTLTAAQIYAALTQQQKDDLFSHYMTLLMNNSERLKRENIPYADFAKNVLDQLQLAYTDSTFASTHQPDGQKLTLIAQGINTLLSTPLTANGTANPALTEQLTALDKLTQHYRSAGRYAALQGALQLLLGIVAAAAVITVGVLTFGTLVLPTAACAIGLWGALGTASALMLGLGTTAAASFFHDSKRLRGLANTLQPLSEGITNHIR